MCITFNMACSIHQRAHNCHEMFFGSANKPFSPGSGIVDFAPQQMRRQMQDMLLHTEAETYRGTTSLRRKAAEAACSALGYPGRVDKCIFWQFEAGSLGERLDVVAGWKQPPTIV